MAEISTENPERNFVEQLMSLQIASDGMTLRRLIKKYRKGELIDAVRCTECAIADRCPIGNKPIAKKMACKDGVRKQKGGADDGG